MSAQVGDTGLDGETEADHVVRWRLERLVRAGYGYGLAIDIACGRTSISARRRISSLAAARQPPPLASCCSWSADRAVHFDLCGARLWWRPVARRRVVAVAWGLLGPDAWQRSGTDAVCGEGG